MALGGAQQAVRDFHRRMIGMAVAPDEPVQLAKYNGNLRVSLIAEEANEFRMAWEGSDRVAMIDALCDLLYVTLGAAVEMGVELDPFFREVHRANMEKFGGEIRPDGKQLKPSGWLPPDIAGVYRRLYGDLDPSSRTDAVSSNGNGESS